MMTSTLTSSDCILLTGFEPFGGETINPSWEVARALSGERIGSVRIQSVQLPCVFAQAPQALQEALDRYRPRAVLCLGQAEGRSEITPERVAINVMQARIPDNAGAQPQEEPVVPEGPAAYFTGLPLTRMLKRLRELDIPVSISNTAGTFVCNQVFYALQHTWGRSHAPSGFVHLPCLPEQAARMNSPYPALSLETQIRAIREIAGLLLD
jgi:pyroglutamyl-peptidase